MKKTIVLMAIAMFMTLFAGCAGQGHLRRGRVTLRIAPPSWHVVVNPRCRWVHQDGGRFKECLGPRGWEYRR